MRAPSMIIINICLLIFSSGYIYSQTTPTPAPTPSPIPQCDWSLIDTLSDIETDWSVQDVCMDSSYIYAAVKYDSPSPTWHDGRLYVWSKSTLNLVTCIELRDEGLSVWSNETHVVVGQRFGWVASFRVGTWARHTDRFGTNAIKDLYSDEYYFYAIDTGPGVLSTVES